MRYIGKKRLIELSDLNIHFLRHRCHLSPAQQHVNRIERLYLRCRCSFAARERNSNWSQAMLKIVRENIYRWKVSFYGVIWSELRNEHGWGRGRDGRTGRKIGEEKMKNIERSIRWLKWSCKVIKKEKKHVTRNYKANAQKKADKLLKQLIEGVKERIKEWVIKDQVKKKEKERQNKYH